MGHSSGDSTQPCGARPIKLHTLNPIWTHITLFSLQVETKQEREARGRPIGRDVPYAAMGGLTGFSSLMDGYLALEASSSGKQQICKCVYVFACVLCDRCSTLYFLEGWVGNIPRTCTHVEKHVLVIQPLLDCERCGGALKVKKVPLRGMWGQQRAA